MMQKVGAKKLAKWSRRYGHTFVGGLHRGGSGVHLVTDNHRHFRLDPMAANAGNPDVQAEALEPEPSPVHWTSCRERWPEDFADEPGRKRV